MANGKANDSRKITAAERRILALDLRKQGESYRAIAAALGVAPQTAFNDVKKALTQLAKKQNLITAQYRQLQLERINMARVAIATQVIAGDLPAVDRWIKLNDQESKLFGLNEPDKLNIDLAPDAQALLPHFIQALETLGLSASDVFNAMIAKAGVTS